MRIAVAAVISCSLALQGCPVYQLSQLPESRPLPNPSPISQNGDFTHVPSLYTFPSSVGGFNRVALLQYDTGGLDVSAGYNGGSSDCPVVLTIYVSPAPRMSFVGADPAVVHSLETKWLRAAYQRWKNDITAQHPQAVLRSEDEKTQDGVPGRKAVFAIDRDESELFVFVVERKWILTYRDSYRAACASDAKASIQRFFGNWRGRSS